MDLLRHWAQLGVDAGFLSDSFSYAFMVNAIVAALLLGPLLGGLGTLVIAKRLAFFSEAVGHAALTGIALGVLLGEPPENPFIGLFSFCMIFALLLHFVRNRTNVPYDTLVGVFLALALAVGAALLMYVARKINIHMLENVLFGSILTVTDQDLWVLAISCSLIIVLLIPTFNRILLTCISPDIARVRGYTTNFYDYLFVMMITLVTIASVKIVGAVLVGALLLIPGATARLLTKNMGSFVLLSALLATISCVIGTILPMELKLPVPSGAAIIIVSAIFFLTATCYRIIRKG
ncbi:metal ABC transporter permease [Photobacterium kishitanii]|uniref:metal ABC transporter permease n=1 Tax=Photobacterium kishitanii TaxID=318456 RepID=UPI000435C19B|nr:metal ABC transporter permease [Photobacterium kishitanii]OBU28893.1 zinc ABC transporter permease [Photobacterium kishitanii]PSU90647.1 metal ABC transporter permease [Photobacterium kishitanii]PSW64210.1 metal ABC transporter permease [Photobacterium kishitanii]CEO40701.1 putative permease of ABC transporter [Photobacterium kishitanii]